MPFQIDEAEVQAPVAEATEPQVESTKKKRSNIPTPDIDMEVFRTESHLLSFQGYIANNFSLKPQADGDSGEVNEKGRKIPNMVRRPEIVGYAVKNEGAKDVVVWLDKLADAKAHNSKLSLGQVDQLETKEVAVGETVYLTKYALAVLLGEARFGGLLGAGVMNKDLNKEAGTKKQEFKLQLGIRSNNADANSLKGTNPYLNVYNTAKVESDEKAVNIAITRYPVNIAVEVDAEGRNVGNAVKPEFVDAFGILAERTTRSAKGTNPVTKLNKSVRTAASWASLVSPRSK